MAGKTWAAIMVSVLWCGCAWAQTDSGSGNAGPDQSPFLTTLATRAQDATTCTPPQQTGSAGPVIKDCESNWCPELVTIPAGAFCMGAADGNSSEQPVRVVDIPKAFAIGKYEITFTQWDACANDTSVEPEQRCPPTSLAVGGVAMDEGWGRGNRPAIHISWQDAQTYIKWLSLKTGETYRLPTEAEWEYACRAGMTTPYHFGTAIHPNLANYDARNAFNMEREGRFLGRTEEVGRYRFNLFQLHDMHGNVAEWVEDCWNETYDGLPTDGSAAGNGQCTSRVLRGGSWDVSSRWLRCSARKYDSQLQRYDSNGFRVARELP